MGDEFKGSILYELICCSQWVDEREDHVPLKSLPDKCSSVISQMNPASFLRSKPSVHENISWITSLGPTWNFAATPDGKIIAILQATSLETRSDRDHFNSHIGRSSIPKDVYPNFRRMEWNQDGSLLAVSYTNGQVSFFDLMATQLFVVRLFPLPTVDDFSACFSVDHALSGLFFVEERVKKATFPNELIVVDRRGGIKSFRQTSADGMDLNHEYSFRRFYPEGTTAVTYCAKNSIILVCGTLDVGNDMMKRKEQNLSHGVTVWRLLNDHPYYRIVFNVPQQEFRMDSRSLWRLAFSVISRRSNASEDTIFKVSISPNSKLLATISTSGTISIWHLPSLKLHQQWPLKSQFQHNAENPSFNCHWRVALNRSRDKAVDPWRFHPFDINWWNNEVVIISRVNGCVSLCSVEDHVPSKNLLGDSPEHFESPVFVSTRFNKGFFALEGDLRIKGEDGKDTSLSDLELVASDFWLKTIYQEIMFLMTDSEQFRPPRKRKRKPPTWIDTHRLFNVRSITPLELFHRKIDAEEYGEALDLAKIYNLDSDLVFQRRWTKTPVTVRSIKDFLAKITKRNWVLQECLDRVPDNLIAARKLLEFGMKGTDLTAAVTISQGRDKGRFIIWAPDDLDISQDEYLSLIDKDNIEVQRLIGYRKQFLHFLDMLNTYEMILGGALLSEENFDSNVYSKLRNNSVLESCIEMARNSDVSGLKIMCINHWVDVSPYYLHILSSFPETTPAHNYRDFLPEVTSDGQVLLWDEIMPKEKDWSDSFPVLSAFDGSRVLPDPETHTVEYICHWYECRVRQIESLTGLTNLSLDLSRLGVERNITKLQNLLENLETVETLVYDIRITDMSLEKLERLSNIEKVELLMSTAKEDSYIENFRLFALPFLNYCERREPGSKFTLLNQYLTKLSQDDLKLTLKIFEQSKREATDPIIADVCDLMKLAYNCIYACKSSKQNDNILALLGCLPDRGYGGYVIKDSELEKLHDAIDQLELHYHAVQILEKYSLPYSLKEIQTMADDEDEISVFFEKLCSGANKKNPPMKVNEWKTLLYDILELHKKIFVKYEVEKCYMTYVSALLRSGYSDIINLARNFLDQTPTEVETDERGELKITRTNSTAYSTSYALYLYLIPYEESLGMVLEAAELYFDSASNYSDPDMELSKVCLNLMQNSKEPSITYMFDLIDAVKVLNKDFNLHILPQSVRRSQEKMGLLKKSMENIKDGYKKTQQLLKLALFLRIDDMDQEEVESCVFEMAGNAGIAESDIKFCTQICHGIMAKGYHAGWKVFTQVAKFQSDPPVLDHDTRLAFINYALNICPNDEIFEVLNAKYLIEIRSLQAKLSELSPSDSAVETAILESQEQESIMHDILNKMKFEEFVHTTTTWINPLKKVAQVVKTGGGAILAGTGRTIQENIISSNPVQPCQEELSNENFLQESYPAFYVTTDDVHLVHTSLLAYKYNSFSSASVSNYVKSNPALELCLTINRIWHLERLLLGTSEAGDRDFKVLEQLVSEILPEDVPWGLAILSSIDDVTVLSKVLQSVPQTQTSYRIILAYLSYRINKELNIEMKDGDLAAGNLNKLISDTANLVGGEDFLETHPDQRLRDLISIFYQYQDYLIDPFAPEVNGGQDIVKGEKSEPDSDDEDYQQGDGWED